MYPIDEAELKSRGFCQCGCGGVTPIAQKTQTDHGRVKGHPCRFIPGHQARTPLDQLFFTDPVTGCWEWAGRAGRCGYGQIMREGKRVVAHRFFYELFVAPLPAEAELHHTCKNRRCVNPDHLVPLSLRAHRSLHSQGV